MTVVKYSIVTADTIKFIALAAKYSTVKYRRDLCMTSVTNYYVMDVFFKPSC
jgi:hypothetical protein